jgi:hypothetical protein
LQIIKIIMQKEILLGLLICLSLSGCGQSEIDKCVEAKITQELVGTYSRSEDANRMTFEEFERKHITNAKKLWGGDFRVECLRAQAGKN